MNNSELENKLIRLDKLKNLIAGKVKEIYEEHNNIIIECTEEIIKRKGGKFADGYLKNNLQITFKSGQSWELKPNYMKNGHLQNVIWKPLGVQAFDIKNVTTKNSD